MSVMDKIRELEEQKQQLLSDAKAEALKKANDAVAELKELGFHYEVVARGTDTGNPGARRTGVRAEVLAVVSSNPSGISRSDILEEMHAKGDKRAEQSISNALANAKKQGRIDLNDGLYTTV